MSIQDQSCRNMLPVFIIMAFILLGLVFEGTGHSEGEIPGPILLGGAAERHCDP